MTLPLFDSWQQTLATVSTAEQPLRLASDRKILALLETTGVGGRACGGPY